VNPAENSLGKHGMNRGALILSKQAHMISNGFAEAIHRWPPK